MADVRLMFPADYLTAAWLKGRDVPLTIARVIIDELATDKGKERKPVVILRELEARKLKGEQGIPAKWVLNRTCAKVIAQLYGHETADWIGKRITLFPTTCQAFGATVDCIRVRPAVPADKPSKKREPEPEPESRDEDIGDEHYEEAV